MDPAKWQRMWDLFHEAETLDSSEQEAFLQERCGEDAEIMAELRSLLAQADHPTTLLDRSPTDRTVDEARPGETVGNYRIVRRIAEGGMGVVYEAEQNEPVRRRVALKLIRPGLGSREVLARFQAERQALALLDHPSIARVYEAGETDDGRPFFVMELVEGLSILEHCDTERLDTDARLELFAQVCDAVQHAHHRGIIHRDLKPSNILISAVGDKPLAKVIDFGVARATGGVAFRETQFTMAGQVLGTPEYMSPEQARATDEDVDTRTDVYALGAILYELLSGAKPFDWNELRRAGYEAMWKVIREKDPPPPSRRLDTLGDRATDIAASRRTDAPSLIRHLNGDLDWVVMRCLEKERKRRYDSPADLARDLERYRDHHPVVARPPSAGYRARKFVRRHRLGVVSAALILIAIVAGVTVGSVNYVRALKAERESARQARVANEVSQFLYTLFDLAGPTERDVGTTTLLDLLEVGKGRVESIEDPVVRGRVLRWLSATNWKLGRYDEARPLLEESVRVLEESGEFAVVDLAASYGDLGSYYLEAGRPQDALEAYRRVLSLTEPDNREHNRVRWRANTNHVLVLIELGRYDEAYEIQQRVLETAVAFGDPEHEASAYQKLSSIEEKRGNHEASREHAVRSLEIYRSFMEPDDPKILYALNSLAIAAWRLEDYETSGKYLRQVLESVKRTHGPDHPYTASIINNLGRLMIELEDWDEAERLSLQALEMYEAKLEPDHPDIATTLLNLSVLMRRSDRKPEALPYHQRAIAIFEGALGEDNVRLKGPLEALARLLDDLGQPVEAEAARERAARIEAAVPG